MAVRLYEGIRIRHGGSNRLGHSSVEGRVQSQEFLEDHAAMLLLETYLLEEAESVWERKRWRSRIENSLGQLVSFQDQDAGTIHWRLNEAGGDFPPVPARTLDHPVPSAVSLVSMSQLRVHAILDHEAKPLEYRALYENDFHNLAAFFSRGWLHRIHAPKRIPWMDLPVSTLQLQGERVQDCVRFTCSGYPNPKALVAALAAESNRLRMKGVV